MRSLSWRAAVVASVFLTSVPALHAQVAPAAELKTFAASQTYPQTLRLRELDASWQHFTAAMTTNAQAQLMTMFGGGSDGEIFYSRGQTVTLGNTVFLVAYRPQLKRANFMEMMQMQGKKAPPEILTPETTVGLALLNFQLIGTISNVKPFDLAAEIAASQKNADALMNDPALKDMNQDALRNASQSNLKQIGLGMAQYAQDTNNALPPMTKFDDFKKELMPYLKTESIWTNPATQKPYALNAFLEGKKREDLMLNPRGDQLTTAEIIAVYEAEADDQGRRNALYLDGHVKQLSTTAWTEAKAKSRIP
ncbi:MAG TPA: hypothetical protein VF681_08360 [Abditibacteriaceae bacterium]